MQRSVAAGLALVAVALLAACRPVVSTAPIGTTVGQGADPRLLGSWVDAGSGSGWSFVNSPQRDGSIKVANCQQVTEHGCKTLVFLRVHTVQLGAFRYIDAVLTDKNGHPLAHSDAPGHILLAYDIDAKGVLTFAFMNADLARSAVKAGKLAGVLTDPDHSGIVDVTLTAPGAQLDAFLATPQGHAMFASTSPGIFRKGYAPIPQTPN